MPLLIRRAAFAQTWADAHKEEIEEKYARQEIEFLEDREEDNWAPLFAIAAVAVPKRFEELKQIAIRLGNAKNSLDVDDSYAIRLLSDIRDIFISTELKRIGTNQLLSSLKAISESPWEDLTPPKLARTLRPFNISSRQLWTDRKRNMRGYEHADFKPAFESYLSPVKLLEGLETALLSGATGDSGFSIGEMGRQHADVPENKIHRDAVVGLLLDAGANINARGWSGETALFSLDESAVRELIRRHADLEARNEFGETPLIETVAGSIADILIKAGANVNARDKDGKTALIGAAESNYVDKLEVLVKAPGIRLEERDNDGETALIRARANNLPASVAVLVAAGATQ